MTTERQLERGSEVPPSRQQPIDSAGQLAGIATEAVLEQARPGFGIGANPEGADYPVMRIPVEVDVAIPIRKFRVRNLLALTAGQVIATDWVEGEDLPLGARGARLAWTEFEVIDNKIAVRITRLV